LLLPVEQREVHYDYSDADDFGQFVVPAYSLEEIAAEKLRGLLFQRVNPSPRDAYDLWYLWTKGQVDWTTVVRICSLCLGDVCFVIMNRAWYDLI